jgi:hypothetical protein
MSVSDALTLTELHGVLPVLQSKSIGEVTVNVISLEFWENCLSANLSVTYPSIRETGRGRTPKLMVHMEAGDGSSRALRICTGHGGSHGYRYDYRCPPIPLGQPLQLTVGLSIGEHTIPRPPETEMGGWYGYSPAELEHDWTEIGEFRFDVVLPESLSQPSAAPDVRKPDQRRQFERRRPIDAYTPRRVIPIVQSQTVDDSLFTLIALECSDEGMLLTSRVQGPRIQNRTVPSLRLAACDDLGNQYVVWSSAGGGDAMTGSRIQWRWFTPIEPVLDPNAQAMFIDVTPDFSTTEHHVLPGVIPDGEAMFAFAVSTALK